MNKRPLPCVLAGFVLGEVWIWQFHGTAAFAALCFAAIMCVIIGQKRKGSFFCLLFLSLGMILGGISRFQWEKNKADMSYWMSCPGCSIEGQISEIIEKESSYAVVADKLIINGKRQKGKLLIYLSDPGKVPVGGRISCHGRIESFEKSSNPGGFDQASYREGRGILGVVWKAEVEKIHYGSFLIVDGIYQIRKTTQEYLEQNLNNDVAGIGVAMALGEKGSLKEEQRMLYELGGISHVLAVSGLHMSLLGAGIYKLFRKAGAGYCLSVLVSIPCIILYAIMTGLASSCQRAAIMLILYLMAELKGYYYDLPSALSLAGIWLLWENPARLVDSGFLLSFGAMVSVGVICPLLFRIFQYETAKKKAMDAFLSGLLITVFSLPLSLFFFYGFSLAGLILNLLVIPCMSLLVPLLFAGGAGWLSFIPEMFSKISLKIAEWILYGYSFLCKGAEKIPFAYIQTGFRGIGFAVSYYILLTIFILFLYLLYRKYKKRAFIFIPILTVLLFLFVNGTGKNNHYITMLDVGQGDGIIYHSDAGEICMVDGGSTSEKNVGQYVIKPALEYYGIDHIDYWFLSHMDEDHISGTKELLKSGYIIKNLILPDRKNKSEKQQELEQLAKDNQTKVHYMKQGDRLKLKKSELYCLHPASNATGDENENSLVLLLNTSYQHVLLTGDVEKEGEDKMLLRLKKCKWDDKKERILKTAHHGSANGTKDSLLNLFKPDTALISCGAGNNYGHPAKSTVKRIQEAGAALYYTMYHGAIEIRLEKETSYLGYCMVK